MNFSITNQVVWLAPERTGTSITKKVFEKYDFFSIRKKTGNKEVNFEKGIHSHDDEIPEKFSEFKIITNIRNPYDRVFACYQKLYLEKPILKTSTNFKIKFTEWISETFWYQGPYIFLSPRYDDTKNFLQKWTFDTTDVDFVIKMENLKEDILKLPFIKNTEEEFYRIENLLSDNQFINERYFTFQDVYDPKSAKLVYEFFKPCFYKFDYSPFSFTKESLSDGDKISFIHNPLD